MRLLRNDAATPTTRVIRVALDGEAYSYRGGQAAWVGVDAQQRTPYSIASAPYESGANGYLEFLVKVDGSTRFGSGVTGLEPGIPLVISPAFGRFGFPSDPGDSPLLFVGGGTGIAPLRSILLEHLHSHSHQRPPALIYSARSPQEFAYAEEFLEFADSGRLNLTLTLTGDAQDWRHARGRAGEGHLAELVTPQTLCFVCGPPSMVTDVPRALVRLGVPRGQIVTEDW